MKFGLVACHGGAAGLVLRNRMTNLVPLPKLNIVVVDDAFGSFFRLLCHCDALCDQARAQHSQSPMEAEFGAVMMEA
jgi:hypothetical protein